MPHKLLYDFLFKVVSTTGQEQLSEVVENLNTQSGLKCEIKALEERHNKDGEIVTIERGNADLGWRSPHVENALVATQFFDKMGKLTKTTVLINSPHLLKIFKQVISFYPTIPSGFDDPITLESPFAMLYHFKDEILKCKDSEAEGECKNHLILLLDFMKKELAEVSHHVDKVASKGFVSFKYLWAIFKPGDLLYQSMHGHARLYRLENTAYDHTEEKGDYFSIDCSFVDYDGTNIGKAKERIVIYQRLSFAGSNPSEIALLPVFPRKLLLDEPGLEDRLATRGKRFLDFTTVQTMHYEGLFEFLKLPPYSWWGDPCDRDGIWTPQTMAGRVVIDGKTFTEDFRTERVELSHLSKSQQEFLVASGDSFSSVDFDTRLCPPFAYGYSLELKVWCKFFIDQLRPVEWQPNPMDSLLIQASQKKVVQALVRSHEFPSSARDEVELKGKGLVILLHGSPGSGKTMTAETAAEDTKRALLRISLSEMSDEDQLEANLRTFQRYATTWGAIVLIDEADVFLEARKAGGHDSARQNSLVAIFLRNLEYFQGIIFLTSNRVSVFDDAIKSRVHLALTYPSASAIQRSEIWRNRICRIPIEERDTDLTELDGSQTLDILQKLEINGREISNSLNTSRTLARDEGRKLGMGHLLAILEMQTAFKRDVEENGEHAESTSA